LGVLDPWPEPGLALTAIAAEYGATRRPRRDEFRPVELEPGWRVESRSGTEDYPMKKLTFALFGLAVAALASGTALAQGRGGSMGGHGGGSMGGHGGGSMGGYHGGGYYGGYRGGGYYGGRYYGGWRGYGFYPGVGVYFGAPFLWGGWPYANYAGYPYAGYPAAYYPYVNAATTDVGVYTQAAPAAPAASAANQYWYYCTDPAGYYPYIQNCSKAWMQVVPQFDPGAPQVAPTQ